MLLSTFIMPRLGTTWNTGCSHVKSGRQMDWVLKKAKFHHPSMSCSATVKPSALTEVCQSNTTLSTCQFKKPTSGPNKTVLATQAWQPETDPQKEPRLRWREKTISSSDLHTHVVAHMHHMHTGKSIFFKKKPTPKGKHFTSLLLSQCGKLWKSQQALGSRRHSAMRRQNPLV